MATGFSTVTFEVKTEDGTFPRPVPNTDRPWVYTATLILASASDLQDLDDMMSRVTEKPALGRRAGKVVADYGTIATLTIPVDNGDEESWTARLIEMSPNAWMFTDDNINVDVTFLCLGRT